jgi:hypothetical protein
LFGGVAIEQRFHFAAKIAIAATGTIKKRRSFSGRTFDGLLEQSLDNLPAVDFHTPSVLPAAAMRDQLTPQRQPFYRGRHSQDIATSSLVALAERQFARPSVWSSWS